MTTARPGATAAAPADSTVSFALAAEADALRGVRLWQEVRIPGDLLAMRWDGARWTLQLPRPAVDRMEYLFELTHPDGHTETVLDPDNPNRVGGAFGEHSVLEFPEYRSPGWLAEVSDPGARTPVLIDAPLVDGEVVGELWAPAGLAAEATTPLLVVHDGPEYDSLAALTHYLDVTIRAGNIPPMRAALLSPGHRDDWYAASGAYTRSLVDVVLPALREQAPTTALIGMGASLGALEMLVAHRSAPGAFDGLFLQSGSYFQPRYDEQESGFPEYDRIVRSVAGVLGSAGSRSPVPVVMTCGGIEENIANNRILARSLAEQNYDVVLHEVRDVHNYTAWRDCFDPYLTGLLAGATAVDG